MSHNTYNLGALVRVSAPFTVKATGAAIDPAAVTLAILSPSELLTTYVYGTDPELVRTGVGEFYADVSCDESGTYRYRWASTGDGQAGDEKFFEIREAFAR